MEFGFSLPDTTLLDPSVVLLAAGCADTATIHASVRNLGAPVQNGELVLELDPVLTYVNATPPPTTQAKGALPPITDHSKSKSVVEARASTDEASQEGPSTLRFGSSSL